MHEDSVCSELLISEHCSLSVIHFYSSFILRTTNNFELNCILFSCNRFECYLFYLMITEHLMRDMACCFMKLHATYEEAQHLRLICIAFVLTLAGNFFVLFCFKWKTIFHVSSEHLHSLSGLFNFIRICTSQTVTSVSRKLHCYTVSISGFGCILYEIKS